MVPSTLTHSCQSKMKTLKHKRTLSLGGKKSYRYRMNIPHTHIHTCTHMHTCMHTHICLQALTHVYKRAHALTDTHTHMHAHTYTHTHINDLFSPLFFLFWKLFSLILKLLMCHYHHCRLVFLPTGFLRELKKKKTQKNTPSSRWLSR